MPSPLYIPSDLAGAFRSPLPVQSDLQFYSQQEWGALLVDLGARWGQQAMARVWEKGWFPPEVGAQATLDAAWTTLDAIATWTNADSDANLAVGNLGALDDLFAGFDVLGSILTVVGEAVPVVKIIAQIANIGLSIQKMFWKGWLTKHAAKQYPAGFSYNQESDEAWCQDALRYISAGDITSIFMPRVELQSFEWVKVQKPGEENEWVWQVTFHGPVTGAGALPGAVGIPWSYQGQIGTDWSYWRPGARAAATASWGLATGPMSHLFDRDKCRAAWNHFWSRVAIEEVGLAGDSRGPVLRGMMRPREPDPASGWPYLFDVPMSQVVPNTIASIPPPRQATPAYDGVVIAGPGGISVPAPPPSPPHPGPSINQPSASQPTWLERYGPYIAGGAALAGAAYLGYRHFTRRERNGLYLPPSVS